MEGMCFCAWEQTGWLWKTDPKRFLNATPWNLQIHSYFTRQKRLCLCPVEIILDYPSGPNLITWAEGRETVQNWQILRMGLKVLFLELELESSWKTWKGTWVAPRSGDDPGWEPARTRGISPSTTRSCTQTSWRSFQKGTQPCGHLDFHLVRL